jgi:hypothetical protein
MLQRPSSQSQLPTIAVEGRPVFGLKLQETPSRTPLNVPFFGLLRRSSRPLASPSPSIQTPTLESRSAFPLMRVPQPRAGRAPLESPAYGVPGSLNPPGVVRTGAYRTSKTA